MKCPFCSWDETEVIKTLKYDTVIIRIRVCKKCQMPWQTHEIIPSQTVKTKDIPSQKTNSPI